ncbi:Putative phospholipase/carboxylesterase/thioesterase, alpha/Beta hydrolase [Septoria linicola]|uniref:Acyl-protein thioesterase 1 n=1 Tax=Septoria linicola TaxID=215465 RepID=A0A9Q9B7X8_9PEZI|nr:putative phospholipase/carboxylesterase/thioesterase, alpha/Beta hydrolase [Septoria linicola]USW59053.1 Putative phospholipase/carboxylesterase/thioesterase, alpha/Beta hydrolase [Septoria linicola]
MSAATLSHNPTPNMDNTAPIKRRMTLPTEPKRRDPIYVPAEKPVEDPAHGAAFILVHGLGDDAEGLQAIAQQFQSAHKLPYLHWIIPNAMESREAMTTAWYTPSSFSAFPPDRPELAPEEDAAGMHSTVRYIETLIDACTKKGIPPQRIVLGGFSQGCAMALLTDLTSKKYSGKLGGIVGLMGYLPLSSGRQLEDLRAAANLPPVHGHVPILLARGKKDQMIPGRVWKDTLKRLGELGVERDDLEVHEYEGLGHSLSGPVLRDICTFVERYVPALED